MINTGNNRYNDEINKAVMLIKLVNLLNLSPFPKQLEEAHQAKMDLLFTIFFFWFRFLLLAPAGLGKRKKIVKFYFVISKNAPKTIYLTTKRSK